MTWIAADDWERRALGDCAKWLSGGTPSKSRPEYWGGTIPWISAKSLDNFYIFDSDLRVTEQGAANGTRLVGKNAILFIVRGMSLKTEFRIGITQRAVTFNQDLKALVPVADIDPHFLAYTILAQTPTILHLVDEAGHGTGRLATDLLQALEMPVPPLPEQRRIAAVLGALDDKIELNRKMNRTLEQMAQAIFKSWFIDFDGHDPADMVESELGLIPRGWRVKPLLDLVRLLSGGTPRTSEPSFWGGEVKWASAKDVSNSSARYLVDTERTITRAGLDRSATKLIPKGAVAVVARGATCGRWCLFGEPVAMNQTCYAVVAREPEHEAFVKQLVPSMIARLVQQAHGSVFDTITTKTFETARVVVPTDPYLIGFTGLVGPLEDRLLANVYESRTLTTLRDTLLPKLISGEIRVPEAEAEVGP